MAQKTAHLCLIHDGACNHTSAASKAFLAAQSQRITRYPWPSHALDDKPIAYLWKKTKQRATHNQYCKACTTVMGSVDQALVYFVRHPETVLGLCRLYGEESGLERKQAA